jgi:hypothetical protein
MIKINKEAFSSTKYFSGSYAQEDKEYEFTLCVMYNGDSDHTSYDVTWMNFDPNNYKEIEEEIIKDFNLK